MRLAYTRLVSDDVRSLADFYERLLGQSPTGTDDYVEFRLDGAWLAICSWRSAGAMHGGTWPGSEARSAILEFEVEDVDAERRRLAPHIAHWIQEPKDMPWGNRSTLFRDPDGNPVNLFSRPPAPR